ncbi:hypothetical protein B296_00008411 [Ensete ventricosum]|uniref:Uncharacterized protein n=1 Tax=Ensete ventricosum TaxID=4639 RepID=A0A427AWA6_ENSVE|nr:hypothetical protein B296_00008411 [Ensete ventricosum]
MAPIGTSNFLQRPRWHRRPLHSLLSSPAVTPFHVFPTDQEHMRSAAAVGATPPPSSLPRGREETKEVESKKQSSALDTGEGGRVEGFKSREKIWGRPHRSVGGSHPHSDCVPPIGPSPPFTVAQVDLKIPNTESSLSLSLSRSALTRITGRVSVFGCIVTPRPTRVQESMSNDIDQTLTNSKLVPSVQK